MMALIPVPPSLTMPESDSTALGVTGLVLLLGILLWIAIDAWRNR